MNFGALSRGFGTCCLRFKNGVATTHAKLASGWLARLYREGVEPSGSLQKVSDHPSSFSGLGLAQGKFHGVPSLTGFATTLICRNARRADAVCHNHYLVMIALARAINAGDTA
jgi:hypothetical protein